MKENLERGAAGGNYRRFFPKDVHPATEDLYRNRFLSEGYPDLHKIGFEYYSRAQETQSRVPETFTCLNRLVDLSTGLRTVAVIGCGPNPISIKELLDRGYDPVGIEPVAESAVAASRYIGDASHIYQAGAEALPLPDDSQRVVLLESVIEHVDSPIKSLAEAYRVLAPGGVLFVSTNNRLRVSLTGYNLEYRTKFFNWFPDLLKECYVFQHLHYDPRLANYTPRPAVHWFSYAELCRLGRQVGFAQFYSLLDLVDENAPSVRRGKLRRLLFAKMRRNPWLRAIALTQFGSSIFMLKRPA